MTNRIDAAVATLEALGYTHEGGNLWKPPLGKAPDFNLLDTLHARIASLEGQLITQANRAVAAEQLFAVRSMPAWEPTFDAMVPGQEELVMQFCMEIAGPKGKPGRLPDPVRLMEMAEALYQIERAHATAGIIEG